MNAKHFLFISCIPLALAASCGDDETATDLGGLGGTGEPGDGEGGSARGGAGGEGPASQEPFELVFDEIPLEGDPMLVTHFEFLPNSNEFLATTHTGRVLHYVLEESSTRLLGEFELDVFTDEDCGLISLTFDPSFEDSGLFYVGYCESLTHSGIARYEFDPGDYESIAATKTEVIVVGDSRAPRSYHNVGKMGFDPDGNLWATFGDKAVGSNSRDPTTPLGKVVRLRPLSGGGYEAPDPPNPVFPGSPAVPIVYAYGLRSPWTATLDAFGRYWLGDVGGNGDESVEELNLLSGPGLDFGYNLRQGPCLQNCAGHTDPIRFWQRRPVGDLEYEDLELEPTTNRVAWVGMQYRETTRDRYGGKMRDKVLYGDMCLGFVRGIEADRDGNILFDAQLGHLPGASAWQVGPDGYVYAVTYTSCLQALGREPPPGKLMRARLLAE